jgi:hypothetical protein
MSASPESQSGFVTADKPPKSLARTIAGEMVEISQEPALAITPEVGIARAKELWNSYLEFKGTILEDPACYDEIDGHREMNRTGATRLAVPFGLSIEARNVEEGRVQEADTGNFDYRYRVTVRVGKGSRFADGIGSCRVSEIPGKMDASKREHFALAKAWTRASKRAIADILGGTEAE